MPLISRGTGRFERVPGLYQVTITLSLSWNAGSCKEEQEEEEGEINLRPRAQEQHCYSDHETRQRRLLSLHSSSTLDISQAGKREGRGIFLDCERVNEE
ncbi:hypothetical protein BHM03_00051814 [Ensete ventricosum]|nr:hypothetical protein BHM03_00051814 [Ensete ventricosum]